MGNESKSALPDAGMYGTQPDVLPETLPAGTLGRAADGGLWSANDTARLRDGFYWTDWKSPVGEHVSESTRIGAYAIDWKSVPRPSSAQSAPFKVGDWVEYSSKTNGRVVAEVARQVSSYELELLATNERLRENQLIIDAKRLRPWQPRPGDRVELIVSPTRETGTVADGCTQNGSVVRVTWDGTAAPLVARAVALRPSPSAPAESPTANDMLNAAAKEFYEVNPPDPYAKVLPDSSCAVQSMVLIDRYYRNMQQHLADFNRPSKPRRDRMGKVIEFIDTRPHVWECDE